MRRTSFAERIPYQVPDTLEELQGPTSGTHPVPINVDWSLNGNIDLDTDWGRVRAYRILISEGEIRDQRRLLNHQLLLQIWPLVFLAEPCRRRWEQRFPQLAALREPR